MSNGSVDIDTAGFDNDVRVELDRRGAIPSLRPRTLYNTRSGIRYIDEL